MGKIELVVSKEDRINIYKSLYIGLSTYNRLRGSNIAIIDSKTYSEVKSRFMNFIMKRQFEEDMIPIDFPYKVDFKNVNNFGGIALFLEKGKNRIQIRKCNEKYKYIKSPARYMLEEAKENPNKFNSSCSQISFFDGLEKKNKFSKLYLMFSYDISGNEFNVLELTLPSNDVINLIEEYDCLDEYKETVEFIENDDKVEDVIVKLKEDKAVVRFFEEI